MIFPGTVKVADLDQRHPVYAKYARIWDELSWLYEAGEAIICHARELLLQRVREPEAMFRARIEAISYTSIIGQVIGWYEAAMFGEAPKIRRLVQNEVTEGPAQERFTEFLNNCDRGGSSYEQMWRKLLVDALLFRQGYVLVDLPKRDPSIVTKADELEKMRPFLVRYDPRSVINWSEDDNGNLQWIWLYFRSEEEIPESFPPKRQQVDTWLYYDRRNWARYERVRKEGSENEQEPEARLVDAGEHALASENVVPVYRLKLSKGHWLGHRCYLTAKKHLNLSNALDWGLFNTAIAILVVTGELETQNVSELAFLQVNKDSSVSYLEQSGSSFAALQGRIEELKSDVFRQAYLLAQARSTNATPAAQSGVSKEADMTPSYEVAQAIGQMLIAGMKTILEWVLVLSEDQAEVEIAGFEFDDSDVMADLSTVNEMTGMQIPSPTLDKELSKRAVRKGLPDLDKKLLETIEAEIDSAPTRQELEQQRRQEMLQRVVQAGVPMQQ
jgi:hypothetical protein